jgi:putative transposase
MVKPAAYRQAVGFVMAEFELSQRRSCQAIGFARSSWRYRSQRKEPTELVERLRALATKRPRWGYRMLYLVLRREGVKVNHKRVYRLYRQEQLMVRTKKRKRLTSRTRVALPAATGPNQRWSMDFVSDVTRSGRRFRTFAVVDDFTRESLALVTDTSIGGARVARVLDELIAVRGAPELIVCDNGPEFTGKALDGWAYRQGVKLHFIRPGRPTENAFIESFNGKLRNECLSKAWFLDLEDARRIIGAWRIDYNENRPHSSLAGMTPKEYADANRGLTSKAA